MMWSRAFLFVQVVTCVDVQVQRHHKSDAPVPPPDHAKTVLRKESDVTMEVSSTGEIMKHASVLAQSKLKSPECKLTMLQQMARLNSGVNAKDGDIEGGVDQLPKWARWTTETMNSCGWTMTFWNDRKHDHIMVAQNTLGNNKDGVATVGAKACAIAFAGSNDDQDWENTNGRKYQDWQIYKKDKAGWTQDKSVLLGTWTHGGTTYDAYKGVVEEYHNITASNAAWDEWMALVDGDACDSIYVTGDSLGGALAQLHYLDLVDNSKCANNRCFLVPFSPDPIFFGSTIPSADCSQSWLVYSKNDPVIQGDPVPVGSHEGSFKEMYSGFGIDVNTVNSVVGAERIRLYPSGLKVKATDYSTDKCSKVTYGRDYFPITDKDESYKDGVNIELIMGMMPWHIPSYVLYQLDAHTDDHLDFFFNWKAIVYFLDNLFSHASDGGGGMKKVEDLDTTQFYTIEKLRSSSTLIKCMEEVHGEWQKVKKLHAEDTDPAAALTAKILADFNLCLPSLGN